VYPAIVPSISVAESALIEVAPATDEIPVFVSSFAIGASF
jgi:hypothetical protein